MGGANYTVIKIIYDGRYFLSAGFQNRLLHPFTAFNCFTTPLDGVIAFMAHNGRGIVYHTVLKIFIV